MNQLPAASSPIIKAVIYSRVSTLLGQDPLHQLIPCRQLCQNRNFSVVGEYIDRITGSAERRKDLDQLVNDARLGKFKVVVIYALDRIARDTRFLLNLIHQLETYGVSLISLRESVDLTTPVGRAVLQILGSIAELEKNLISERIKTALAVKKLTAQKTGSGWRCGRKPVDPEKIEQAKALLAQGKSIRATGLIVGLGKSTIERIKRGKR